MAKAASSQDLQAALLRYDEALAQKASSASTAKELVSLDAWYRGELRERIAANKCLHKEDLVKLVQWKLSRGKFRPTLMGYARGANASEVEKASAAAFKTGPSNLDKAMKELTSLKGVGPATASAIMATHSPDEVPFLSDEAALAMGLGKPQYTAKFFTQLHDAMRAYMQEDKSWTLEQLEKACWAWVVLGSPSADSSKAAGSSKRSVPAGDDEGDPHSKRDGAKADTAQGSAKPAAKRARKR